MTTTFERQYAELMQTMRDEPIDFIGTDYAIDERQAEETILPLARDKGIAVLVYAPFGRTRLWQRVKGRQVPDWAREFDANSWAQFFLKFVASHPAVTAVTPATSRRQHGGQHGRRHGPAAGCGHAKADDPARGGIALRKHRREFLVVAGTSLRPAPCPGLPSRPKR